MTYSLNNYGCYCYPVKSNEVGPYQDYKGPPVDELDHLCKKFWISSKCLPEGCDRTTAAYTYEWQDDEVVCTDTNECLKAACELEVDFNDQVAFLITNTDFELNEDEYTTRSTVIYENICDGEAKVIGSGPKDHCCGVGIERKHYNEAIFQCCGDVIVSQGTC